MAEADFDVNRSFEKEARVADYIIDADVHVTPPPTFWAEYLSPKFRDIAPKAETHLLVLPERHVSSFREISEFPPDEAKRMLEFVAETARAAGLDDYRVIVNVGEGAGQTVFHLHWHVLGGRVWGMAG